MRPFWLPLIFALSLLTACAGCALAPSDPHRSPSGRTARGSSPDNYKYSIHARNQEGGLSRMKRRKIESRTLNWMMGFSKMREFDEQPPPVENAVFGRAVHGGEGEDAILDPYGAFHYYVPPGDAHFDGIPACDTDRPYIVPHGKKAVHGAETETLEVRKSRLDPRHLGEAWTYAGRKFRWVNVGGRTREVDQRYVDAAYAKRKSHGDQTVWMYPAGARERIHGQQREIQSRLTALVIDKYADTHKGEELDIVSIRHTEERSDATDVLLLIEEKRGHDLAKLTARQLRNRAIVTVQLHRDKIANYSVPTEVKHLLYPGLDPLAFERRMLIHDTEVNPATHQRYRELKGSRNVAEVTRYAAFNRFDKPLRDAVWAKLLEMAKQGPDAIGMLVFSVGPGMARNLRDLEFSEVGPIKTLHDDYETLKYLYVDDTDPATYDRVYARLRAGSVQVTRPASKIKNPD